MNIKLRDKISKAIDGDFVGNYIFTDEELQEIYDETESILKRVLNEYGGEISNVDYSLVFVALVNLAKEWNVDEENALFDHFYKRLLGNISTKNTGKVYKQITKIIYSLSKANRIFMLKSYQKKYYATLCSHSFTPLSSINSFFDMCWEIYCNDLEQQYIRNDSVFELITQTLHNKFTCYVNNEEDFEIGSKIYSFRIGIRGLAIDEPELMTRLLDETICCINSLFNNEPIKLDTYLKKLINNWWKQKEISFGLEKIRLHVNKSRIITDYSQIKAKYILEDSIPKLVIPSIRLKNNFDYNPYIEITINEQIYECVELKIKGSGILMATESVEYILTELPLYGKINISIEITHRGNIIYNSGDSLYREFILFKDSKEIISQECLPGMYFLYTNDIGSMLQYPQETYQNGDYTYSLESYDGEILQSKNRTVFFVLEKMNHDIYFFAKEKSDVIYRLENEEYKVIDGDLYIDVNDSIDDNEYGVRYEDCSFKLNIFAYEKINDKRRYNISSVLKVGEHKHITIFEYKKNKIISCINIIKFNNINVIFDKELYYGINEIGTVSFKTEKYNFQRQFLTNDNEISIAFENGEIILFPPVLRWKIDNGNWNIQFVETGLWYKNLGNSSILTLEIPKTMNCVVALTNNDIVKPSEKKLEYKIGEAIYYLAEHIDVTNDFFPLFVKINEKLYGLIDIYYREEFIAEPLYILSNSEKIFWIPKNYIGDNNSRFRLDIISKKGIVFSKKLTTKNETIDVSNIEDGHYKYKITLLQNDFINKERELYSKEFVLGDEKKLKFKNKTLLISKVMLFDMNDLKSCRTIYIENINYLGAKDYYDYYCGNLYIIDKYGKKIYLNKMKNEKNDFIQINPIRIELKDENSCYLGCGLDLLDTEFEYDSEFNLNCYDKITVCQNEFGKKTKGINYFVFEVKENV